MITHESCGRNHPLKGNLCISNGATEKEGQEIWIGIIMFYVWMIMLFGWMDEWIYL